MPESETQTAVQEATETYVPGRAEEHPMAHLLRQERMPHIWCSGCGLGTTLTAFLAAVEDSGIDQNEICVLSGIGCAGRAAGYVRLDSFHTTHGRAIPFGVGLHLANPRLKVVVFSGDGDIVAIGGNHFIHAARRNIDMLVICVNNFIYGMTGGQVGPTTPVGSRATTAPYGNFEHPFNIVHLAAASGASYVARWTSLDVRRLRKSIREALGKKGFRVIEVISPCPTLYGRLNKERDVLQTLKRFRENTVIAHGKDPAETDLSQNGKIYVGKFVDVEKPTFLENMLEQVGDQFPALVRHVRGENGREATRTEPVRKG
jgi:2-oxoglutarate ferredoxin oxidoreductase subunit beta